MAKSRHQRRSRPVERQPQSQTVERDEEREEAPMAESCDLDRCEEGLQGFLKGHRDVNIGETERVLSVMGGGVLTVFGATRGGLMGLGLAILGGSLLYRGVTGHCEAYHVLGLDTSDPEAPPKPGAAHG